MKSWLILSLLFFQFNFAAHASKSNKPNFILVFCDDLGYADIGPFGAKDHSTPALDKMANEGMKLTDFYSTWPFFNQTGQILWHAFIPGRSFPSRYSKKAPPAVETKLKLSNAFI